MSTPSPQRRVLVLAHTGRAEVREVARACVQSLTAHGIAVRLLADEASDLGLADVRPGDETIGMATALLSAGSATVIASVSRIADEVAMATMTRFHEAIAAGAGPAAALASAVPAGAAVGFVCLGSG